MENNQGGGDNKTLILFIGIFIAFLAIIVIVFFAMRMISENKRLAQENRQQETQTVPVEEQKATTSEEGPSLPSLNDVETGNGDGFGDNSWEAQNASFGDFYKYNEESLDLSLPKYSLPQNVKVDVANYYDFSRKINLDTGLDSLNQNGFAVIDNPFPSEAKDFYGAYSLLEDKQVPALVTSDFLIYYYHNVLKNAFKDIEGTVFYDNLWYTNKRLYSIAKERYESDLNKTGLSNDLTLEGSRRELAFFATTLALLSPTESQIGSDSSLNKTVGFTPTEASEFSFALPSYLKNDVEREVELIRKTKEDSTKSPVLLYERNYKDFAVPAEYKNNARLNNFFLAAKWLNSPFPLLYRSESCPECLLDKDDWRLSMYSAFLVADDINGNQDIQNRWAKIYKIMSFFQGLRGDLSYLDYRKALTDLFGEDKSITDALSEQDKVDENLTKLQETLLAKQFSGVEGGLDKNSTTTRKYLGMKMLVEGYWPTSYIFNELTYPRVGFYQGSKDSALKATTACNKKEDFYRCLGMAFDVMNVMGQMRDGYGGSYFASNTAYEMYTDQAQALRSQFANFTDSSWHNNSYWSTLDIVKKMMSSPDSERPDLMRTELWRKKELSTAVSAWVDLQLPPDKFTTYQKEPSGRLGTDQIGGSAEYGYVEPNLALVKELSANTDMVLEMLKLLKVGEQENTVLADLSTMKKNFQDIDGIVRKELNGEDLNSDDYKFLGGFVTQFSVKETGIKVLTISSPSTKSSMQEKLEGLKLEVIVYYKGGKRYFAAGPVFNYWESRKQGF